MSVVVATTLATAEGLGAGSLARGSIADRQQEGRRWQQRSLEAGEERLEDPLAGGWRDKDQRGPLAGDLTSPKPHLGALQTQPHPQLPTPSHRGLLGTSKPSSLHPGPGPRPRHPHLPPRPLFSNLRGHPNHLQDLNTVCWAPPQRF